MPEDNKPVRRYTRSGLPVGIETRADGKKVIAGYAAVFYDPNDPGTEYRMWSDMVERIMPGAFDDALREDDVRGLYNHDESQILGRTKSGTMRLSVDQRGLRYEIDPPDTSCARDLLQSLERKDIDGSSFLFKPIENTYRDVDDLWIIERRKVKLFDVGPVCFPAYTATEASVRSATDAEAVRREVEEYRKQKRSWSIPAIRARARAVVVAMTN